MIYKFGDIANNVTEKRSPKPEDSQNYIGLEHLDSGSLYVNRYGIDVELKGDKLIMHKGDVLLGKRNAYLRRAAIAPHDGLFSAHGMILRPKDVIASEFFPFFIASDKFFDDVIRISVGGLSPTVNWKDLKELEFDLPSLAEQKVLAEKLWAAYEVKQSYLKMIEATEEMVKSQFIEMFGKVDSDRLLLSDIADVSSGLTKNSQRVSFELKMPYLRVANVFYNKLELDDIQEIGVRPQEIEKTKLQENDLLFVEGNGSPQEIGRVAIWDGSINPILHQNHIIKARLKISSFSPAFLMYFFMYGQGRSQIVRKAASSSGLYTLSLNKIASLQVPAVELEFQQQFVSIAHQADKSISELRKSIDAIKKVIKSLINENL